MKTTLTALVLAATLAPSLPALADDRLLNFESLANSTQVLNAYAGFQFSDTAWSFVSTRNGGSGDFYGGAPGSENSALTLIGDGSSGGDVLMRVGVDGGFGSSFSVSVGALSGTAVSIQAFDAAGQMLNSLSASGFSGSSGCMNNAICHWTTLNLALDPDAKAAYVELSAPEGTAWFDDMSFGAAPTGGPGNTLPEPSSAWLGLAALGALALARQLKRG